MEEDAAASKEAEVQPSSLTQETIIEGLSLLCRTGNGLRHAFAKLCLPDKRLNDIAAVNNYIHLRFLDVSNNCITDLSPLAPLTHLLWLKADNNDVATLNGQPISQLMFLQWLSMAGNQIEDLDGLVGPTIEYLNLSGNAIKKLNGLQASSFANLVTLELRGNQVETTDGLNLPNLRQLYLAKNVIKSLEGLDRLERLSILHLRENKLQSLNGLSPNMKNLHYLNARDNLISDEKGLQCIGFVSKTLQTLILTGNPVTEKMDYRIEVILLNLNLRRLDKDPVSRQERLKAWRRMRELREEETPWPEE